MLSENFLLSLGKVIAQVIGEILYFPIWWYSVGFIRLVKNVFRLWRAEERALGFGVWAKNIFTPMYGQSDWGGRLISFFVRLFQIIFRGALLLIFLALLILVLIIWLALPLIILFALVWQVIR